MASTDNIGLNGIVAGIGISLFDDNRDNNGAFIAKTAGVHTYSLSFLTDGVTLINPIIGEQYLGAGYYYIDATVIITNYNSSAMSTAATFCPSITFGYAAIRGHSQFLAQNATYT